MNKEEKFAKDLEKLSRRYPGITFAFLIDRANDGAWSLLNGMSAELMNMLGNKFASLLMDYAHSKEDMLQAIENLKIYADKEFDRRAAEKTIKMDS